MVKPGKQNMCEFMKHPDKEPILKMLLERLNDFGKMDFSCPVQPVSIEFNRNLSPDLDI